MIRVTTTWHNPNPNTIWNKLAMRLGREPMNAEAIQEMDRLLSEKGEVSLAFYSSKLADGCEK